jgi:predicted AAA+ superfamily ATPase
VVYRDETHGISYNYVEEEVGNFMERAIMKDLLKWKESKYRKPLILNGVRQVGKTWILEEFGRRHYENVAYFNFEENPDYAQFFELTKDPLRIFQNLSMLGGQAINEKSTLVIFDEIQSSSSVINSLKYICEKANQYHVVCAGSLLGVTIAKPAAFPVGKVDLIDMYPMTFLEFLEANGDGNLSQYINSLDTIEPIPDAFYNILYDKIKMYYLTGGMPEPVKIWTEDRDSKQMQVALNGIITAYERDFAKYPEIKDYPKISLIWQSIPSQLSKENKKFLYKVVKEGARAREYEDALQWLVDAGLVYKVYRSSSPGLPMKAYDDISAFKIYLADVGLLSRLSKLAFSAFSEGNRLFTEFRGSLSENYVLQSLINQYEVMPRYWTQDNPKYEVDFMMQHENIIIPIEVKAERNIKGKSLVKYNEKFPDKTPLRVRFSMENLKLDGNLLNIPLFLSDRASELIGIALEKMR